MNQIYIVTFAWSLAFACFTVYWLFRCKHDWEPVVERELPAVAEIIDKAEVNRWGSAILTYKAGRRKFFAIVSCKKCGAIKEFKTLSGQDPEVGE
jgi:hypothetical protein